MPSSSTASPPRWFAWIAAAIRSKRSACVEAYTSPEPNSRNAEPTLPITRYFRPLSSEASDHTSSAHSTYSEIENSSSATNRTSRLLEAASSDIPATAGQQQRVVLDRALVEPVRPPGERDGREARPRRRGS